MPDTRADTLTAPESTDVLHRAGRWFLSSGIQNPDGGVARYYLAAEGRNLPVSTEITGYAAAFYAWAAAASGDASYRAAAARTAGYLVRECWMPEAATFPFERGEGSPGYFFDCGIIVRGLLAVHRVTGDPSLLPVAESAGRSMARDFLTDAAIHPVVSLPERTPLPYEARWSREPGCFQLKAALAWRDLWTITGDPEFRQWWEQALAMALGNADRFLPGAPEPEKIMDRLHAFSYFLEALLAEPDRKETRNAFTAGLDRAAGLLRDISPVQVRADVEAQILRVRLLGARLGVSPLDRQPAGDAAASIARHQYEDPDPRLDGGFCFGTRAGVRLPFANPVTTAFCAQALSWWREPSAARLADLI